MRLFYDPLCRCIDLSRRGFRAFIVLTLITTWLFIFLQINNQEVRNREEAIRLFSETRSEIVLLICRPASLNQVHTYKDLVVSALGSFKLSHSSSRYASNSHTNCIATSCYVFQFILHLLKFCHPTFDKQHFNQT